MADIAILFTGKAAAVVVHYTKQSLLKQCRGQYNEEDIKERILSVIDQIKDDTKALRNVDFKTARDSLQTWTRSVESKFSDRNISLLKRTSDCAAKAFNAVKDPLDKIMALSFLVFADYHYVSLTSASNSESFKPNWTSGKREAQQLLKQYVENMEELRNAATEELGSVRGIFKDKKKRLKLLFAFVNLSNLVFALHPMSENGNHPHFDRLEQAASHAFRKNDKPMLSVRLCHIISEPVNIGTLRGHRDWVTCCKVLADGSRAISGSNDKTLKVWNLMSGEQVHTLQGHTDQVTCCAVLTDGSRVISGSNDKTLRIWDLESGKEFHTLQGHTDQVTCCAVLADGSRAISGSTDKTLRVWYLESGKEVFVHILRGHEDSVTCCSLFADGSRAISGSIDKTLRVWDLESTKIVQIFQGHNDCVTCCAVLSDGSRVMSGSNDKTLRTWDLESGKEVHILRGHANGVWCCTVFSDGLRAISGSSDKTLRVWDLENGKEVHTIKGHRDWVTCCAVLADGSRVISGSYDATVKIWDVPSMLMNQPSETLGEP